jgi:hypothetical protein
MSDAAVAPGPTVTQDLSARRIYRLPCSIAVLVAGVCIGVIALWTRLTELRDVPRLTDETDEIIRGLQVARAELLPLTNVDAYIGPLWSYLLALGFVVVGPSAWWPRLLALGFSLLTVVASVWLGQEIARRLGRDDLARLVGGGAAFLLAASSFHALMTARIGWSHVMTPLFTTLALAALLRWERTRDGQHAGRLVVLAGLMFGLAVHSHPTAIAFGPGLALWALLHYREVLLARTGWVAILAFLLANLPMLAFNLASGFGSAAAAAQVQLAYAGGEVATPAGYVRNLGALLGSLPLLLAGQIGERRGDLPPIDGPAGLVYAGLALAGLVLASVRRVALPSLVIVSAVLVLPIVNGKYEPLFNGRYIGPLLPLGFALVALAVGWIVAAAGERIAGRLRARIATVILDAVRLGAVAAILTALAAPPLLALDGYIQASLRDGPNNRELYRAAELVAAAKPTRPVLVDATLSGVRLSTGRDGTGVVEYALIMDARVPVRRLAPEQLAEAAERGEADIVIASPRVLTRLDKDFITEPLPGEAEARRSRRMNFVVFRVLRPA